MKKFSLVFLAFFLFIGIGSPVAVNASTDGQVEEALKLIDATNQKIDEKIAKAVQKADQLQADYMLEVRKLEEGDLFKLNNEKIKVSQELKQVQHDADKQAKLEEKLEKINNQLVKKQGDIDHQVQVINQEIAELIAQLLVAQGSDADKLKKDLAKLHEKLESKSEKHQKLNQRYVQDLEKVIADVFNETLEMSTNTIEKAAKMGVQAECSWKLVRFADQWVWIDPIRVVGC